MSLHPDSLADGLEGDDSRAWLSAAADGDADAMDRACKAWRDDPSARATWHAYHLIGDVLRSGELAAQPSHDAAFLHNLRLKLASEAVVLAPAPLRATKHRASAWLMPAVAAAGFVVVAGVLVVSRVSAPQATDRLAAPASPSGVQQAALGAAQTPLQIDASLLRNPRLDEFLRAHQAARGGMAVPGSALRRADIEMPAGTQR